ncbi:MAG: hypothetical protein ABJG68_09175 [Crocinitomicaceae bacterium]
MIERKCLKCGVWNKDEDYCNSCQEPLSPRALDKVKEEKKAEEERNRVPSKSEVLMLKAKNSKYLLVRWMYYVLYSIFMVIGAIGAMMAWMAALANA